MKKQKHIMNLVITNIDDYLQDKFDWCFRLRTDDGMNYISDDSVDCGKIKFSLNLDEGEMIAKVVKVIDNQIKKEGEEFAARVEILKARKQQIQALPAPSLAPSLAPAPENNHNSDIETDPDDPPF